MVTHKTEMDKISSSCYSLHVEDSTRAKFDDQKPDEQFSEIIVSCKSLSSYESKDFKSLIPQIIATAISASFHIVVGIALAYSAILVPQLEDVNSDLQFSKNETSWIASIIVIVVPIGAIIGGFIMDGIGRLNTIKLCTIPVIIGWILIAMAQNIYMILAGRVLTGLVAAWGTSPAVVYITEIARPDMRGSFISCCPAYASLGMVLTYLMGWFLSWRTVSWISNIFTIIPAILLMFIPESPAWLVSKGRIDEAKASLEWIYKYNPKPLEKQQSFAEMQLEFLIKDKQQKEDARVNKKDNETKRLIKAFLKPTGLKPTCVLVGLFFFQQFSGIYVTLFYSVTFFIEMGSNINPYFSSVLIGVVRLVMSIGNTIMLKRFRRRPLVMISSAGMAVCMLTSGFYTLWIKEGKTEQTWVPVLLLLLHVVTSMIGMLPIPWTMTAELYPLEIRGIGHSISYSFANILMFASLQAYRPLNEILGGAHATQWFFAGVSLVGVVWVFIFLPETHSKKLSEIEDYFKNNTIYLGKKKTSIVPREKKPIIKNRSTIKDIIKSEPGQNENLIA